MDDLEYNAKLDELDHLLNDADVPLEPARIWDLLAAVSHHDLELAGRS
ncbi:peptide chain release factor 1 [Acetobacteraceae bacterium KSS8]|uniref:Peptide chain release factor 1 n=1 Tax=Endosaccharibacter trunci TaxID=2812733 RepID=A0ABT1WB19_9PROT|nr:peptide chain release factor 1 [Acetobacteraceae bacterium KSS8]